MGKVKSKSLTRTVPEAFKCQIYQQTEEKNTRVARLRLQERGGVTVKCTHDLQMLLKIKKNKIMKAKIQ